MLMRYPGNRKDYAWRSLSSFLWRRHRQIIEARVGPGGRLPDRAEECLISPPTTGQSKLLCRRGGLTAEYLLALPEPEGKLEDEGWRLASCYCRKFSIQKRPMRLHVVDHPNSTLLHYDVRKVVLLRERSDLCFV